MDALFICKFKPTEDFIIEIQKAKKAETASAEIIFDILIPIIVPMILFMIKKDIKIIPLGFVCGISTVIFSKFRYGHFNKNTAKITFRNSDKSESTYLFYDKNIISVNEVTKSEKLVDYTSILKVTQTKNLYFLFVSKDAFIPLDKNRFEKGTCEEFEEFIKSKAVNARIKL